MLPVARLIAIASALLLAIVAVPILAISLLLGGRDPFDRFEVIAAEAAPVSGRHAVTYRYHHANSSSGVYATWILPRAPPLGSTEPPAGTAEPVLVWTNQGDVGARRWREGVLAVTARKGTDRRAAKLSDCYFEYEVPHLVCFDPRAVQLAEEPAP